MAETPVFAAGAVYDRLLQAALRRFFSRAAFETHPLPQPDERLTIETSDEGTVLTVGWLATRHVLRVPAARPFTAHEIRFARAIGRVLAARHRAVIDPRLGLERGDLFGGTVEDRYVGAFVTDEYPADPVDARADRIESAIEVLRVAALSRYENRPISSGLLLLASEVDPLRPDHQVPAAPAYLYSQTLMATKSFYRLCDGLRTLFLVNASGAVLDIVEIERWVAGARPEGLPPLCATPYRPHARATAGNGHVCIVLSPTHEIMVFAEGVQMFTFRNAGWHLLDLDAKFAMWQRAVGNGPLADRIFQTALDLAAAREGALFVVLRDPAEAVPRLVAAGDQLEAGGEPPRINGPSRQRLRYLLTDRVATALDPRVFSALAGLDGAVVMDRAGRLLAAGAILLHPAGPADEHAWMADGARTTAALAAARFGPVLKVSEDGVISFYDAEPIWDI